MGNKTTVGTIGIGGAFATLIAGTLKYYQPELMNTMPGAEAALAVIITGLIAWCSPAK